MLLEGRYTCIHKNYIALFICCQLKWLFIAEATLVMTIPNIPMTNNRRKYDLYNGIYIMCLDKLMS